MSERQLRIMYMHCYRYIYIDTYTQLLIKINTRAKNQRIKGKKCQQSASHSYVNSFNHAEYKTKQANKQANHTYPGLYLPKMQDKS